jgi:hypothetical protein
MNNSLKRREYLLSFCNLFPIKFCNLVIIWLFSKLNFDMPTPLQQSLAINTINNLYHVWSWISMTLSLLSTPRNYAQASFCVMQTLISYLDTPNCIAVSWSCLILSFPLADVVSVAHYMHRLPFVLCKLWFPTLIPQITLQWAEVVLFFLFLLQMLLVLLTTYLWLRRRQVFKIFCLHLILFALCTICLSSPLLPLQCSSVWPMTSFVKEIAALLLQ